MSLRRRAFAAAVAALMGMCFGARAPAAEPSGPALPIPSARSVVTHHEARIGGREVQYTATAGTILLENAKDQPTASVFYVAYVAQGLGPSARRPIAFAYNGGPGGSSALIHLGAFGPRMVVTSNATDSPPPPYEIEDNEDSLLDKSDLVFVDAVGTGYSRLAGSGTAKDYYGVDQDGKAFAQFIRRYVTANDRWNSPKYLLGESYGTTRSAVVAKMLEDDGIRLSGILLMSTVLDFATLEGGNADDLLFWLYLPTEAALAAYYHKLPSAPADLDAFLAGVRTFAAGPYAQALAAGSELAPAERDRIASRLHELTGLPLAYILRSRLRVPPDRFEKELLGDDERSIGRFDGRFSQLDLDPISAEPDHDASSDAVFGAFVASANRYLRDELGYTTDAKYEFLSSDVNQSWDWNRGEHSSPGAVDVTGDLADAMTTNRYLHVLSVNGLYDLATPFFATEYELRHLNVAPQLQANIAFRYYPAGHMIYLNPVAHDRLKADLDAFFDATSGS